MRPLVLGTVAIALAAQAGPALAQMSGWTGPYAGGRIGYAGADDNDESVRFDTNLDRVFGDTVTTASGADAFARGSCSGAVESDDSTSCSDEAGVSGAVHVGYDVQVSPRFVVGALAEYGYSDVTDSVTAFSSTPAFYTLTRRLRGNGSIRVRAGYAILPETLAFATGGIAYGRINRSFRTSNGVNTFTESRDDEGSYGYRVGGGVEQRLMGSFSVGLQYLFTSLDDDDYRVRAGGATVPVSNPFILQNPNGTDFSRSSDQFKTHDVSIFANFRF